MSEVRTELSGILQETWIATRFLSNILSSHCPRLTTSRRTKRGFVLGLSTTCCDLVASVSVDGSVVEVAIIPLSYDEPQHACEYEVLKALARTPYACEFSNEEQDSFIRDLRAGRETACSPYYAEALDIMAQLQAKNVLARIV